MAYEKSGVLGVHVFGKYMEDSVLRQHYVIYKVLFAPDTKAAHLDRKLNPIWSRPMTGKLNFDNDTRNG